MTVVLYLLVRKITLYVGFKTNLPSKNPSEKLETLIQKTNVILIENPNRISGHVATGIEHPSRPCRTVVRWRDSVATKLPVG